MSFDIFLLEFAEGGGFEPLLRRIKNQSIIFLTKRLFVKSFTNTKLKTKKHSCKK